MLKVGLGEKKKTERKKYKKHANSIARIIRAHTSRLAVSFACLKLHHAAKKTQYKTRSISEY